MKALERQYIDSYDNRKGCFAILAAFGVIAFIMAAIFIILSLVAAII